MHTLLWLAAVMYLLALGAALAGMQAALAPESPGAGRRPVTFRLVLGSALAALVVFPTTFLAAKLIPYFIPPRDRSEMWGIVALLIGLGCAALASLIVTHILITRNP